MVEILSFFFLASILFYWEIIADNLSKGGWSLGYVSALDSSGRTIWIADAFLRDPERGARPSGIRQCI